MELAVSVAPGEWSEVEVAVRQDDSEIQKEPDVLFRYRVLEMLFLAATVVKLKSEGSRIRAPSPPSHLPRNLLVIHAR
jgi:hypothetical protein